MGRTLQNRKRRSSRTKIQQSNRPKKALNPRGNNIIARNWNHQETLTQNYRRLGLTSRLKAPSGGVEKRLHQETGAGQKRDRLAKASGLDPFVIDSANRAAIGEARVERDANGKIIKVQYLGADGLPEKRKSNPLNDPLVEIESDSDSEDNGEGDEDGWGGLDDADKTEVVRLLEEEASRPIDKKPRHQSQQEREWVERLVARHGEDTASMARDRKLNPMQQTQSDIARRVSKWKALQSN